MFHPDDGRALHAAGFSNRVHIPRPEQLAEYWRGGRDPLPDLVQWIADGLIDTISGDDVPFIAKLVERAGKAAPRMTALSPLKPTDLDNRLRVAEAVVREAGRVAADHFARRELLKIDRKGAQDLVSEADRACEDLIVARARPPLPRGRLPRRGARLAQPRSGRDLGHRPDRRHAQFPDRSSLLVRLAGPGRPAARRCSGSSTIRSPASSIRRGAAAAPS